MHHRIRRTAPLALALFAGLAWGCEPGQAPLAPSDGASPPEPFAYRGDAVIVRLVREAAARHGVPRDVLLSLGWSESHFEPQAQYYDPASDELGLGPPCGFFGLDRGGVREAAAAGLGVSVDELCEEPELEVDAAAARLRQLAGGDAAPALSDTRAWLDALDRWHPWLAGDALDYGDYVARQMYVGFRREDERGDVIYLPPIDGLVDDVVAYPEDDEEPAALAREREAERAEQERIESSADDGVGVALGYARPDTPDATWMGPSCNYTPGRSAAVEFVIIHTCEGGFAGCYATLKNCTDPPVSAHYVVSLAGEARQVVEERDTAWHVGCLNGRSVGIEHEGYAASNPDRDAMYRRSARIVASICSRHGFACDRSHVIGHGEANSRFCGGSHTDPGPHWNWTTFMDYVRSGTCTPSTEVCNGRDDDCDGRIDEGVTNACGTCGAVPAEVCDGRDNDCDGQTDEDDVCDVRLLQEEAGSYAPPSSTDIDGDGRSDLCARGYSGFRCWPTNADGTYGAPTAFVPWSNASGWDDVDNYATIRMGDLNGDGRADVCGRANAGVVCALSNGTGFGDATTWSSVPSDANGWNSPGQYTTLRLADVNGDGKADLCGRGADGVDCWLSDGTRFDRAFAGPRWGNSSGWNSAKYYGTLRMGDVNGDGKADLCARAAAGTLCWLSDGASFATRVEGPVWSNDAGFGAMRYWSTMRLADVNGDGKADLCIRTSDELRCHFSTGSGFGEPVRVAGLSDASGWDDISNYGTLRTGDVDGDGAEDLCIRSNTRIDCWAWHDGGFTHYDGPAWTDENGWSRDYYYTTIRLADANGDGRADVCARASAGWRCHLSSGEGFGDAVAFAELTNDGGWTEPQYFRTIQMAGVACVASDEVCNGRDDDCDGQIDENASEEVCNGRDDDCDGEVDEGLDCTTPDAAVLPGADAGVPIHADAGPLPGDGGPAGAGLTSTCACRAVGGGGRAPLSSLASAALFFLIALSRRRARSA